MVIWAGFDLSVCRWWSYLGRQVCMWFREMKIFCFRGIDQTDLIMVSLSSLLG